jgi:hypothetical protein
VARRPSFYVRMALLAVGAAGAVLTLGWAQVASSRPTVGLPIAAGWGLAGALLLATFLLLVVAWGLRRDRP